VFYEFKGGHLNPAVSLGMALIGRLPFKKVLFYWVAQYLGAFAAAAVIYGVYNGKTRWKSFIQTNKSK